MSASIRGDKNHVRIIKDGQQIAWLEMTRIDASEDSQNTESYYCGKKEPETDTLMMGFSGQIVGEVKNQAVDLLIHEIRTARKSGVALPQVSIIEYEEYPDGGVNGEPGQTFLYTDVQFIFSPGKSAGGANEKVTKGLSFKSSDRRPI